MKLNVTSPTRQLTSPRKILLEEHDPAAEGITEPNTTQSVTNQRRRGAMCCARTRRGRRRSRRTRRTWTRERCGMSTISEASSINDQGGRARRSSRSSRQDWGSDQGGCARRSDRSGSTQGNDPGGRARRSGRSISTPRRGRSLTTLAAPGPCETPRASR